MDKRYRYEASTVVSESEPLLASFVSVILARYAEAGHRAVPLYRFLCRALVGRISADDWLSLTPDEWTILTRMAIHEGVAGLLWRASGRDGWRTQAPLAATTALYHALLHNTARNALLLAELEQVLAALEDAGVEALLLKGAALALTLYEAPGLRTMGDLDLLVPAGRVQAACHVMEQLGYRPELSRLRQWLMKPVLYEHNYDSHKKIPFHVELHWNLVFGKESRYNADMAWFWRQSRQVQVGGQTARVLMPDAELLHLAAHITMKHGDEHALLRWYYDLHLLVQLRSAEISWDDILAQAAAWHWSSGLYIALLNTIERFGTSVPESVLSRLSVERNVTDIRYIAARSGYGHLGRAAANWRTLGWRGRLALLMMILVPRPVLLRSWLKDFKTNLPLRQRQIE